MLNTTFCKYWTLIKINISICVSEEPEVNKNDTGAMTTAINGVCIGWLHEHFYVLGGVDLWFRGVKIWLKEVWGNFSGRVGMSNFSTTCGTHSILIPPARKFLKIKPCRVIVWKESLAVNTVFQNLPGIQVFCFKLCLHFIPLLRSNCH